MKAGSFNNQKGQTLIEILVAVTIVGIIFTSIAALIYVGIMSLKASRENAFGQTLLRDMSAGVRGMLSQDWHSFWGSSGLVSYWPFDEATGTIAVDPVNGNNGLLTAGPVWQSGTSCKVGGCLSFDTNSWLNAVAASSTDITGDVTVALWLKRAGGDTGYAQLASKISNAGPVAWGLHEVNLGYRPYMIARIGNIEYSAASPNALPLDTWRHIAGVRSGTNLYLYEDGVSVATSTIPSGAMDANGSGAFNINHEAGAIAASRDDVRIYNRAFNATEIAALANYPGRLYPQNNSGFWSTKEGTETVSGPGPISPDYTRWFTIGAVRRDASSTISGSGDYDDPSTKLITYYVSWLSRTVTLSEYVSRGTSKVTAQTNWNAGPNPSASPVVIPGSDFASSTCILYSTSTGKIRVLKSIEGCSP